MQRFSLTLLFLLLAGCLRAQELRYVDASTLTLINKANATEQPYHRVDTARYPELTTKANSHLRCGAGIAVVFRTDSRTIGARWTSKTRKPGNNLTPIAQTGLDLYIRQNGEWIFAGFGCNKPTQADHQAILLKNMDGTEHECLLYLPIMDELSSLEIGVDPQSEITPISNPFRGKVVILGSSITHGIAASRAGMTYPAQLERRMNVQFVNLGISGQCQLNPEQARMLADTEADLFIIDCFSNPSAEQIDERFDTFVEIIRQAHPTTPLVFLQTLIRETTTFDAERRDFEQRKRDAAEKQMQQLLASGDKHIYWIDPAFVPGKDGLVDGVHPSDLGFLRVTDHLEKELSKIFRHYHIGTQMLAGGYGDQRPVTKEDMAVFRKAMAQLSGVGYKPESVSTQVVAGRNYRFVCTATPVVRNPKPYKALVTIFQPLPGRGEPKITSIERL